MQVYAAPMEATENNGMKMRNDNQLAPAFLEGRSPAFVEQFADAEWVYASDLQPGDVLMFAEGSYHPRVAMVLAEDYYHSRRRVMSVKPLGESSLGALTAIHVEGYSSPSRLLDSDLLPIVQRK